MVTIIGEVYLALERQLNGQDCDARSARIDSGLFFCARVINRRRGIALSTPGFSDDTSMAIFLAALVTTEEIKVETAESFEAASLFTRDEL